MKKLLSMIAVAALILTGCVKDLQVKTPEKLTVEYGDKLDNDKLYDAKESDENVKVDKVSGYDAKKVGDQTLKVTFTDGDKSTEKEIKITVKDTKKPKIVLKKDKITITAGDKLTLKDNVKSVKDPVDGSLKYSDKEIKKSGYYIDKGKLDTKKAGTYEVVVKAFDANGNTTDKTFKVRTAALANRRRQFPLPLLHNPIRVQDPVDKVVQHQEDHLQEILEPPHQQNSLMHVFLTESLVL